MKKRTIFCILLAFLMLSASFPALASEELLPEVEPDTSETSPDQTSDLSTPDEDVLPEEEEPEVLPEEEEQDTPESASEELLPDVVTVEEDAVMEEARNGAILKTYQVSDTITATLDESGLLTVSGTGAIPNYNSNNRLWRDDAERITALAVEDGITGLGKECFQGLYYMKTAYLAPSVETIGASAFNSCARLEQLQGMEGLKTIGETAFYGTNFGELTLPEGLVSIGKNAFTSSHMTSLHLPSTLTTLEDCTQNHQSLESITVAAGNTSFASVDGVLFTADRKELVLYPAARAGSSYTIPEGVQRVRPYAFSRAALLEQVLIPASVTELGEGAFYRMSLLREMTIPATVTSVGNSLLSNCPKLERLDYQANTEALPSACCQDCTALSSVTLPENLQIIRGNAFGQCASLTHIEYPPTLDFIEKFAFSNTGITEFPDWLSHIGNEYRRENTVYITGTYDYQMAYEILELVNQEREKLGENPLVMDAALLEAAMLRSAENALESGHMRLNGYTYQTISELPVSENCATSSGSASNAVYLWMHSTKGHRENLLYASHKYTGVGVFCQPDGMQYYFVQLFQDVEGEPAEPSSERREVVQPIEVNYTWMTERVLTLTGSNSVMTEGDTGSVSILCNFEEAGGTAIAELSEYTLTSDNPQVATVSPDGTITALRPGSYQITATLNNRPFTVLHWEGTVVAKKVPQTIAVSIPDSLAARQTGTITVTNSFGVLSFVSDHTEVVSVLSDGTITAHSPGTATITITAVGDEGHEAASEYRTVTVTAMDLAGAHVTAASQTFTGQALTPAVQVTLNGKTLTQGTDYTVRYADNTNAGTATVTVTGKGNYTGSVSGTFAISKVTIAPTVTMEGWTFGAQPKEPQVAENTGNGQVTFTYAVKGTSSFSEQKPSNAGAYTVKTTIAETANYTGASATADFTIAKATITPTVTMEGWTYGTKANEPVVDGNPGSGAVTITYAAKGTNEFKTDVPTTAGSYIVKAVVAESNNYLGGEATAEFTISKGVQTVNATAPASVVKGNRVTVTATGSGPITYTSSNANIATVTDTGVVTGIAPGTVTITVTVEGDQNHESASKQVNIVIYPCTAPAAPSLQYTANGLKISWAKSNGAAKYRIFYKYGTKSWAKLTDTSTTSYTWKKGVNGTTYAFTIRCLDSTGAYASDYNKTGESIVYYACAAPAAPTLQYTANVLKISWAKSNGAAKYRIFYKYGTKSWAKLADTSATSYTWNKGVNGTTYTFTIRCLDSKGSYASDYNKTGRSIYYLAAPTLANSAAKSLRVNWKIASGVTGYQVAYATSANFSGAKYVTVKNAKTLTTTITSLKKGTTYYVRFRTYTSRSGSTTYSVWSGIKSVKIS